MLVLLGFLMILVFMTLIMTKRLSPILVLIIVPWGGPTARAATALHVDANSIFTPMVPALVAGLAVVLLFAWRLGVMERRRIRAEGIGPWQSEVVGGSFDTDRTPGSATQALTINHANTHEGEAAASSFVGTALNPNRPSLRPKLFWFNLLLTVTIMVLLVMDILPLPYLFMVGAAIALLVNFRTIKEQGGGGAGGSFLGSNFCGCHGDGSGRADGRDERNRHGGRHDAVAGAGYPRIVGTLHGSSYRRAVHPYDVLHEQRCFLLRYFAGPHRNGVSLRYSCGGYGARVYHRSGLFTLTHRLFLRFCCWSPSPVLSWVITTRRCCGVPR